MDGRKKFAILGPKLAADNTGKSVFSEIVILFFPPASFNRLENYTANLLEPVFATHNGEMHFILFGDQI